MQVYYNSIIYNTLRPGVQLLAKSVNYKHEFFPLFVMLKLKQFLTCSLGTVYDD